MAFNLGAKAREGRKTMLATIARLCLFFSFGAGVASFAVFAPPGETANSGLKSAARSGSFYRLPVGRPVRPEGRPKGRAKPVRIVARLARKLAHYKATSTPGVPRGWRCLATYGSGGSTVFVRPRLIESSAH